MGGDIYPRFDVAIDAQKIKQSRHGCHSLNDIRYRLSLDGIDRPQHDSQKRYKMSFPRVAVY